MAAISEAERNRIFGLPGQVRRITVTTPWGLRTVCHELLAPLFLRACRDASACTWKPLRVDGYNPRPIRGTENYARPVWSMHAYALAWDFFATPPDVPPPGGVWTPDNPVSADFAACFTRQGFRWGKTFSRTDIPHIEWPGGLPGGYQEVDDMPTPTMEEAAKLAIVHGYYELIGRVASTDPKGARFWLTQLDKKPPITVRAEFLAAAGVAAP